MQNYGLSGTIGSEIASLTSLTHLCAQLPAALVGVARM
jgi:hypothetical protein